MQIQLKFMENLKRPWNLWSVERSLSFARQILFFKLMHIVDRIKCFAIEDLGDSIQLGDWKRTVIN